MVESIKSGSTAPPKPDRKPAGVGNPALRRGVLPDGSRPAVLVTMLDISPIHQATIVRRTRFWLGWRHEAVYVVDSPDFLALRRERVRFEYVPSLTERRRHRPEADWARFLEERYALLLTKWRPRQVIAYGTRFEDAIAAERGL